MAPRLSRRPPLHESIPETPFAVRAAAKIIINANDAKLTMALLSHSSKEIPRLREQFREGVVHSAMRLANVVALKKMNFFRHTLGYREKLLEEMSEVVSIKKVDMTKFPNIRRLVQGIELAQLRELFHLRRIIFIKIIEECNEELSKRKK